MADMRFQPVAIDVGYGGLTTGPKPAPPQDSSALIFQSRLGVTQPPSEKSHLR